MSNLLTGMVLGIEVVLMRSTNSLDNCCNCYPGGLSAGPEGLVMMALRFFESDSAEEMDDPERRLVDALLVSEA